MARLRLGNVFSSTRRSTSSRIPASIVMAIFRLGIPASGMTIYHTMIECPNGFVLRRRAGLRRRFNLLCHKRRFRGREILTRQGDGASSGRIRRHVRPARFLVRFGRNHCQEPCHEKSPHDARRGPVCRRHPGRRVRPGRLGSRHQGRRSVPATRPQSARGADLRREGRRQGRHRRRSWPGGQGKPAGAAPMGRQLVRLVPSAPQAVQGEPGHRQGPALRIRRGHDRHRQVR